MKRHNPTAALFSPCASRAPSRRGAGEAARGETGARPPAEGHGRLRDEPGARRRARAARRLARGGALRGEREGDRPRRAKPAIGAICPHDDYLYAGRGYVHAMRVIKAPRVVLFGVSHTARRRGVQGKLVFETFDAWRVGGRECPVSPLREELLSALPREMILVSDTLHGEEHSLEGFVPMLQHYLRTWRSCRFSSRGIRRTRPTAPRIRSPPLSRRSESPRMEAREGPRDPRLGRLRALRRRGVGRARLRPLRRRRRGVREGLRQDLEVASSLTGAIDGGRSPASAKWSTAASSSSRTRSRGAGLLDPVRPARPRAALRAGAAAGPARIHAHLRTSVDPRPFPSRERGSGGRRSIP